MYTRDADTGASADGDHRQQRRQILCHPRLAAHGEGQRRTMDLSPAKIYPLVRIEFALRTRFGMCPSPHQGRSVMAVVSCRHWTSHAAALWRLRLAAPTALRDSIFAMPRGVLVHHSEGRTNLIVVRDGCRSQMVNDAPQLSTQKDKVASQASTRTGSSTSPARPLDVAQARCRAARGRCLMHEGVSP